MKRDYYARLGVLPQASQDDIKRAYRRRARGCHPDVRTAEASHEAFLQVQEAYEVLSDRHKRAHYDRQTAKDARPGPRYRTQGWNVQAEWLGPAERDEILDRMDVLGRRTHPGSRRWMEEGGGSRRIETEIYLTRAQARGGLSFTAEVPATQRCPRCEGWGRASVGVHRCPTCGGGGCVEGVRRIELALPPGLAEGEILRTFHSDPLDGDLELVLHVRLAG